MNKIIEKSFNDFESAKVFVSQLSREDDNYYKINVNLFYQYCHQDILLEGFSHSEKIKETFFGLNINTEGKIILKDCLFGNLIIKNNFKNLSFVNSKSIENTKISITQNNPTDNIDNKLIITIENTESDHDLSLEICSAYFLQLSKKFANIKNSNFNKIGEITIESPEAKFNNCNFLQKVNLNIRSNFGNKIFDDCVFHGDIALKNLNKLTKGTPFFFKKGTIQSNMFSIVDTNVDFSEVDFTGSRLYVEKNEEENVDGYGLITIPNILNFKSCKNLHIYLSSGNSLSIENLVKNDNIYNKIDCRFGLNKIELNDCEITDFTLTGEITDKAIFNKVTFKNPPEIGDIKFKNCNVDFSDVKFGDINSSNAIAGFRALNKACRDANYHHGEIFFHGLTLEGIGKKLKYESDFVEKLLSDAYEVFSDFGRSVNRPLYWLVYLFSLFFIINFPSFNKINDIKLLENSVISKSIVENNKNCEEQFQLVKIHAKIVFKNAIGPLQLALTKDFISDCESKFYNQNSNSIIYFLNFFHAVISLGIWFIWFFMIRARFKL
jgi:hypothetical protein